MAKFNQARTSASARSPITATRSQVGRTFEGATGYKRDARSELFLGTVTWFVENTFYEKTDARTTRLRGLIRDLAVTDPEWMTGLIGWLRNKANLRSVSILVAAEAAKARLDAGEHGATRQMVAASIKRADEPGEFLAYWKTLSRNLPKPVKRGVADGAVSTYTEYSWLRNKGGSDAYSMRDVLNLVHPDPADERQEALFALILADAYGRPGDLGKLPMLKARDEFAALSKAEKLAVLDREDAADVLRRAGISWQALAGFLGGRLPAAAWGSLLPSMGYREILMNLRNMNSAGLDEAGERLVASKLADRDLLARSGILPLEFLSAYRANEHSMRFNWPLEKACNGALANVPALPGRTLVLVDCSQSMNAKLSGKGTLNRRDGAAMFGTALALRAEKADLVAYGTASREVPFRKDQAVLSLLNKFGSMGGTDTVAAMRQHFAGHDRVILLTDEQEYGYGGRLPNAADLVPAKVPVFTWNLAGYEYGASASGSQNRHVFGGLNDVGFEMLRLLDRGFDTDWPF